MSNKHDEHMVSDFGFYVTVTVLCIIISTLAYMTYLVLS